MAEKSDLPFGAQFSPNQVDLRRLLAIVHDFGGDRAKITQAICDEFFDSHAPDHRLSLTANTVLALHAYGLLGEDKATPTNLAEDLLAVGGLPALLDERFARHILVDCKGTVFVETILAMQAAGEQVDLHTLGKRLQQRGLHVPRGVDHLSSVRLWLAKAGIFDPSAKAGPRLYDVNQARLGQILGVALDEIEGLAQLNAGQRAFLRALARLTEPDPLVANRVADLATMLYGVEYNHKELPKSVLFPLRDHGYIEVAKSTGGRGAKPSEVTRTAKFQQEISDPILSVAAEKAGLVPKDLFERPLAKILQDLKSGSKATKGKSLELLAVYLTRLIDLDFKGWRTRSVDTGGAEVDAIVEGARLIFSRWQIQAKNTATNVPLEDIAKEVGLSLTFIYSNVVMMVTTGDFTKDAYAYVDHVMKISNLNVILLNGFDLNKISEDPTKIVDILNDKAERAMRLKERADYLKS